jgi:prepilin-type N-terminal cleavage/methylation domain-containing protein
MPRIPNIPHLSARRGITLIEMLVVVALIALIMGISYPSVSRGLDGIRLRTAADDVASFLGLAMNQVERTESPVVVRFLEAQGVLEMSGPGVPLKTMKLAEGISIAGVRPAIPGGQDGERNVFLLPGGTFPRLLVDLTSRSGGRRTVAVDPVTGSAAAQSVLHPEVPARPEAMVK